ncbi:MAG: hypothetical protein WC919_01740 [Candidatus Paceibacterota bacterium]|jgi:hypothetical protein
MSYESKLDGARAILEAHNSQSTKKVDTETFFTNLTEMGGSSEDSLSAASWEDLEACGVPRILARRIATLFRGEHPQAQGVQKVILEDNDPEKLAKAMTPAQLLDVYDPKQLKTPVAERLKFHSEGKKFIVFNDDGTINKEVSLKLLSELDDHGEMPTFVTTDGDIRPTYAVGERPDQVANEHPLFPGVALRNGVSTIGCDWDKVDWKTKKTLYLAVTETLEIDMSKMHELDVYSLATTGMVGRRCIEAAKLYKEREAFGNLPSLRAKLGSAKATEKKGNNPFNLGKNRSL